MEFADVLVHYERIGPIVYLATVTPDGRPHTVPVHANWADDRLYVMAGIGDRKTRNIGAGSSVLLHAEVSDKSGWDSLLIEGEARILDSVEDKRRLWHGVFTYDLDLFSPGGPDNSPGTCFLEITPTRAVYLARFGFDGREVWVRPD